jgi:hypothetical protein
MAGMTSRAMPRLCPSSPANTDATLFHNPKRAHQGLLRQEVQHALDGRFHCGVRLVSQPEHDDAHKIGWRVSKDVGKVQVQRDESTALATANLDYALVRLTTKSLLHDGMSVVPGAGEHRQ